ncbi:MAG: hypothetical protein FJ110_14095 [Deltaproteobacteria bacterium]|nr:hypothetical protein [Deltaproteobacteria bacterium]
MRQKIWVYNPPKPKLPGTVKVYVEAKAMALVNDILKPEHVKPPPKNSKWNYIVDLYTKWHRNYFYFCARYACPGPNALSPFFDTGFARLEYAGSVGRQSRFNLSYMRHTGKWWEIRQDLSLEQCLSEVREGGLFHP